MWSFLVDMLENIILENTTAFWRGGVGSAVAFLGYYSLSLGRKSKEQEDRITGLHAEITATQRELVRVTEAQKKIDDLAHEVHRTQDKLDKFSTEVNQKLAQILFHCAGRCAE